MCFLLNHVLLNPVRGKSIIDFCIPNRAKRNEESLRCVADLEQIASLVPTIDMFLARPSLDTILPFILRCS